MTQQRKKRLLSVLGLTLILCMLFGSSVTAQAPELSADVSEVAEQKSVIDEQAMMLPIAGVSLALTPGSESLTISPNNYPIVALANEDDVAEEVYSDGWTNASVNVRKEPNEDSEVLTTFKYNTLVSRTNEDDEWSKIEYEGGYAYIKSEYISDEENESLSPYRDLIDSLTDDEKYLIYQITFLEAGNQSMEGQRAVVEVILNRVLSDMYPDTVEGVLSQSGQFTTWGYRNSKSHNEEQEEALQLVYEESPVLTLDYLMFSRGKFSWGRNYVQIGDHWFGTF